jgi:hypothetical protein
MPQILSLIAAMLQHYSLLYRLKIEMQHRSIIHRLIWCYSTENSTNSQFTILTDSRTPFHSAEIGLKVILRYPELQGVSSPCIHSHFRAGKTLS